LLESLRGSKSAQEFNDRTQLLRVALNTLSDPVTRLSYDAKLSAGSRPAQSPAATRAVATRAVGASSEVRADALSLRADALALRADAMLVRAGLDGPAATTAHGVASAALTAVKTFTRALGLLFLVAMVAFWITRCVAGDPAARRAAVETKANEQTALQEYYQTYGVRPASMAELELLEAERKRRDNQGRQVDHDRDKQEREARLFEEESRRLGREVSEQLRRDEEQARYEAERERQQKQFEQHAKEEAEQRRIEMDRQQWRETLRH
jgi:hypothetical protein